MRDLRLVRLLPLLALSSLLSSIPARAAHQCFPEPLRCGETRNASLDASECFLDEESWADFYTFTGPAGRFSTACCTIFRLSSISSMRTW